MLTADQPDLRDGARRAPGRDPRAQQREDQHRHRQRKQALAGLERVEADHDLQVHRDDEERAHQDELLPDQRREPGPQLRDAQQRRVEQHVAAEAGATLLPLDERPEQREPSEHHERHDGEAQRRDLGVADRQWRARLDEAPHAAAQDRDHDQAQSGRGKRHPDDVEPRAPRRRGRLGDPSAQEQDRDHDHGLGREHVAPRELGRHPAADQRTGGDRDRGDPAEQRVRQCAVLALVGRGGERRDRRHHQHGTEPLDPRPSDQQDGQVRAQRGGERADSIDRQPDREGPVAAQDVAQLRAEQHERRHHQRVQGDRGLHTLDRRVEVLDDLRDRHVHHARVEHHDELRRGKDDHGQPLAHGPATLPVEISRRGRDGCSHQ